MNRLPIHLSQIEATGAQVGEPVAQYEIGRLKNFVYLIMDWKLRKAALVDCQSDLSQPLEFLHQNGFELESVFLTHTHHDHVAGLTELARRFPELKIYAHTDDHYRLKASLIKSDQLQPIGHEQSVKVGTLNVQVFHTPGHSPGESCYFLQTESAKYLFTGDTVFIRDCGRTDLEFGSNEQMFHSLQFIKTLPQEAIILPGHHYKPECASFLEKEIQESAPFKCLSIEELASLP